jgi:3-amino-5-hydroxybenzoate synthase
MDKLAITGGNKVRSTPFPPWPYFDETEREALNRVLDSRNWWANQGKEVKEKKSGVRSQTLKLLLR